MGQEKASVAQAERELKSLRAENVKLTKDLEDTRSLYKQLVDEAPLENFCEQRVHLLKAQVIQLERQILLQSDALNSRTDVLLLVGNSLQNIADQLRELLASDVKGPSVPIQRSQLTGLIETAEGARLRLYKNVEVNNSSRMACPLLYMGSFLKPSAAEEDVTLLDVCSGKTDLNLKHVAKLESKLFTLHKHLKALDQSLQATWSHDCTFANRHVSLTAKQRLSGLLVRCQRSIAESCSDLVSLSILVPSAPWPLLIRPMSVELTLDSVMSALPNFPRSKQQQGRACVDAILKACNYSRDLAMMEAKACTAELQFHQSVYNLQNSYTESLFTAVREAYSEFEQNTQKLLCQPLQNILEGYFSLRTSTSEEALARFLTIFKANVTELETVVDILTVDEEVPSPGQEALSTFGRDFFASIDALVEKCATERDQLTEQLETVKRMKEDHMKLGLKVFETRKADVEPTTAKEEYENTIGAEKPAEITKDVKPDLHGVKKNSLIEARRREKSDVGSKTATPSKATTVKEKSLTVRGSTARKPYTPGGGVTMAARGSGKGPTGPKVIARLGSSSDLNDILRESGRCTKSPSVGTPSPTMVDVSQSESASATSQSGKLSRLRMPSKRRSYDRTDEGSRQSLSGSVCVGRGDTGGTS